MKETGDIQKSLAEFDIIERFFNRPCAHATVLKAIGDDGAVLRVPPDYDLVVSMDTLVAGRHFPLSAAPGDIARRAFCTSLSDLAAMGAQPAWFTLGLTLPEADTLWLREFSQALLAMADHYQCDLVGGDTTQGPLTITLQCHGLVQAGKVLSREAARVGDSVFVTGTLGDGAAALAVLEDKAQWGNHPEENPAVRYLLRRFYQPEPQIAAGLLLVDYIDVAIDISDGLLADLGHIARASGVDITVDTEKIPLSPACKKVAGEQALPYALSGGDDYQLAFTVAAAQKPAIQALMQRGELPATEIGRVLPRREEQPRVRCFFEQRAVTFDQPPGYQHFAI